MCSLETSCLAATCVGVFIAIVNVGIKGVGSKNGGAFLNLLKGAGQADSVLQENQRQ